MPGCLMLAIAAVLGIAAALWLLLLSALFLHWPGFVGMAMLLAGATLTPLQMTAALGEGKLSNRSGWSVAGALLILGGVVGLLWGFTAAL